MGCRGLKMHQGRLRSVIRKNVIMERVVKPWNRLWWRYLKTVWMWH